MRHRELRRPHWLGVAFGVGLAGIFALSPQAAHAQDAPNDRLALLDRPRAFAEDRAFETEWRIGYSFMQGAGDSRDRLVFGLAPRMSILNWSLRLDLEVPLHTSPLALERNAFNETSDWFAILERLRYGAKDEGSAYFHLGRLYGRDASVRYGNLVDRFSTVVDLDSPTIGLMFDFDFGAVGFESFVASFTDWDAMALRGFVRPFSWGGRWPETIADIELGVTLAADWDAPESLVRNGNGVPQVDARRNIRANTTDLLAASADLTVPLVYGTWVELRPFVEGTVFVNHGAAVFAGLGVRIHLPIWDARPVDLRLEFHHLGRGFIPSYFDTFYLVERYAYPTLDAETTKLRYMQTQTRSTSGVGVSLRFGITKLFEFRGRYADYFTSPGQEYGRLMLQLRTLDSSGLPFRAAITYAKRGVWSWAEAFRLDESAMLLVDLAVQPFGDSLPMRFGVTIERLWRVEPSTGQYGSATAITPFVAYAFTFD